MNELFSLFSLSRCRATRSRQQGCHVSRLAFASLDTRYALGLFFDRYDLSMLSDLLVLPPVRQVTRRETGSSRLPGSVVCAHTCVSL